MHWFLDPVMEHYADFEGRSSRQQYGMFILLSIIVSLIVGFAAVSSESVYLNGLFSLVILLPSLSIGVRRIHDLGRTGWWMLMMFIPLLNLALFLGLLIRKGDKGSNEYGANPYSDGVQKGAPSP